MILCRICIESMRKACIKTLLKHFHLKAMIQIFNKISKRYDTLKCHAHFIQTSDVNTCFVCNTNKYVYLIVTRCLHRFASLSIMIIKESKLTGPVLAIKIGTYKWV